MACMSTLIKPATIVFSVLLEELRNMVEDSGTDEEIPLPNVKTAILSKVIDYCKWEAEETIILES